MSVYVKLRDLDALEIAEMLEFIRDWIDYAFDDLDEQMTRFTAGGYTLGDLRGDLDRFAFLLGSDGHRYIYGDER
jgi:hypothetical protein